MPPEKIEEIKRLELPQKWQILQLVSLQIFGGSIVACVLLSFSKIEVAIEKASDAIHKGWGLPSYAIVFGMFIMIGVVSGFFGGLKALQILIKLIRMTKNFNDNE